MDECTEHGERWIVLAIDLFCGLGGWAEGFLAEGYDVIGFDIEQRPYPGQLILQDALTLHGSQFRHADAIVASPPCQKYSYMAMPWKRSKELAAWYRESSDRIGQLNALFDACFRIQREASEAAGREIPMVVENVKGAQPWVGRARAHFGSFYLWGDINAVGNSIVVGTVRFGNVLRPTPRAQKHNPDGTEHGQGSLFKIADSKNRGAKATKNDGGSWFNVAHNTESGVGNNPAGRKRLTDARGTWFDKGDGKGFVRSDTASTSGNARKLASAQIAKIPFELAQHIASVFKPSMHTERSRQKLPPRSEILSTAAAGRTRL